MRDEINRLLQRYLAESQNSITDTAPSALRRGEGILCDYYILKVDLCDSTSFLKRKQHSTYLRLAHVFLSTIDHITKEYGAENNQNEYAGDGIIAYFPCDRVSAFDVLLAAFYCRYAAEQMKGSYPAFKEYKFETKVVLHKTELIMAKIGPWGLSRVTAIGYGLHRACKLEQKLTANEGRATVEFVKALDKKYSARFMRDNYHEEVVAVTTPPPSSTASLRDVLSRFAVGPGTPALATPSVRESLHQAIAQPSAHRSLSDFAVHPNSSSSVNMAGGLIATARRNSIASILNDTSSAVAMPPKTEIKRTLIDHNVCWGPLRMYTEGKLKI